MIVTLTLNPSLDRTIEVPELVRGSVIRSSSRLLHPGGKGVNVARALLANGVDARAVLPVGGAVGRQLVELLLDEGVRMAAVEVGATTRSNLTLSEPDGTVTKINVDGEPLTSVEIDTLAETVMKLAHPSDWVVLSGSLPRGVDPVVYARLAERFGTSGISVAVDTSGPALGAALAAGPVLVKPNRDELAEAVGAEIDTLGDVVAAAQELRQAGAGHVLASLGPDGAVFVDDTGVAYGRCAVVEPRSTVGAGDCLLAGFLAAWTSPGTETTDTTEGTVDQLGVGDDVAAGALATALRWAAAAVERPGSGVPSPDDIAARSARVTREIDLDRGLTRSG
jgi:1-phosphofructokinase